MNERSLFWRHRVLCIATAMLVTSTCFAGVHADIAQPVTGYVDGYEDISVGEAYSLLSNTSNGVQIPIDVRTDSEWRSERIDTPYPEFPRHFPISQLSGSGIQEFKARYGGQTIILYCKSGGRSSSAAQTLADNGFTGTLYNMEGGITAWKNAGYPTRAGNTAPDVPARPSGPSSVHAGYQVSYTTMAADPDGDPVRYGWDWDGDGTVDEWTGYQPEGTTTTAYQAWTQPGSYQVSVQSQDTVGDESEFSPVLTITVDDEENSAPAPPEIDGPSRGKAGEQHEYTFTVSDPDGDQIYIWVEWGGGCPAVQWRGPYDSGDAISLTNTWNDTGTYLVKARARDIYNEQSDWGTLEVTMPFTQVYADAWDAWEYIRAWFVGITGRQLLPQL